MLHEFLGVDEYLALQLPSTYDPKCNVLSLFFTDLAGEFDRNSGTPWVLPPFAHDFVDFLRTSHLPQVKPVIDHITQSLEPFTTSPSPVSRSVPHSVLPFIWFATHLFLASPLARDRFVEDGMLDIIEEIWLHDNTPAVVDKNVVVGLKTACCLLLGAYSATQVFPSLSHHLRKERRDWFFAVFPQYILHHRLVSSICSTRGWSFESESGDRRQFYNEILELATYVTMILSSLNNPTYYLLQRRSYRRYCQRPSSGSYLSQTETAQERPVRSSRCSIGTIRRAHWVPYLTTYGHAAGWLVCTPCYSSCSLLIGLPQGR